MWHWSAKLFLSAVLLFGGVGLFFFGIAVRTIILGMGIRTFVFLVPACFVVGFILGLLAIRSDAEHRIIAKGITIMHGLCMLGIGYLYYDFAMNFSMWN